MQNNKDILIDQRVLASIKNATQGALAFLNEGFKLFPVWPNQKNPLIKKDKNVKNSWEVWAKNNCSEKTIKNYGINNPNWGLPTGLNGLIVVDVDCKKHDGYKTLKEIEKKYGPIPDTFTVRTPSGGTHYVFWDTVGVNSGSNVLGLGIDVRAEGGYILTPFSSIDQNTYLVHSNACILDCPDFIYQELLEVSKAKKQKSQEQREDFSDESLENSVGLGDRNDYLFRKASGMRGLGLHRDAIMSAILETNLIECDPPIDDEEVETIVNQACQYKPNQVSVVNDFLPTVGNALEAHQQIKKEKKAVDFRKFNKISPKKIKRLKWAIKGYYLMSKVGILAAGGGTGKSIMAVQQCVAIATGRGDIIGEKVEEKMKCWYHNGEEDGNDLDRRISAITKYFEIPINDTENLLYTGQELDLVFIKKINNSLVEQKEDIRTAIEVIKENNIKVWVVDPLIKFHQCDENSSNEMDQILKIFNKIAFFTGCSILLVTHSNKASFSTTGESSSVRGSSSQVDAARLVLTMRTMDEKEMEHLFEEFPTEKTRHSGYQSGPIENKRQYVRIDSAKQNFSPTFEKAKWFRHTSVNCLHEGGHESVGILEPVTLTKNNPDILQDDSLLTSEIKKTIVDITEELGLEEISLNTLAEYIFNSLPIKNKFPTLNKSIKRIRTNLIKPLEDEWGRISPFLVGAQEISVKKEKNRFGKETLIFYKNKLDFLD